ncbi:NAD(P)/FAD-dependent oxidoreductase [Corallococcus sp. EGB]|uniref:NAD(P)/FAD-dependent oxidoreductase n=1 Tax=Corallococcus sp. EGB TaxID=1521117 RepID=UPI001CBFD688|nr:NAD(P)/FAD-dependent oxidoreductase [Corallococcus sp. EGB]
MPIFDKAIIGAGGGAMYYLDARMGSDLTSGIREQLTKQFEKIASLEARKKALEHLLFVGDRDTDRAKAPEDGSLLDLTSKRAVFKNTVLIGMVNPWHINKGDRYTSRGGNYVVNHSRQVISTRPLSSFRNDQSRATVKAEWQKVFQTSEDVEGQETLFAQSQGYTTRESFKDEWLDIIGRAENLGLTRLWGNVTKIEWKGQGNEDEKHFEITFTPEVSETTPSPIKARELLLMTGNGSYLKPTEANGIKAPEDWEDDDRIMDMDQLMRFLATTGEKRKRICIQGGNAAIDAVEQAIRYGHEVHWLVRSGVNILANSLLVHAPGLSAESANGSYLREGVTSKFKKGVSLAEIESKSATKLHVKAYSLADEKTGKGESEVVTKKKTLVADIDDVDYYVYCIGQEVNDSPSGVAKLLVSSNLLTQLGRGIDEAQLELIYDEGWLFRSLTHRKDAVKEAAIGLRKTFSQKCRIDVLGAASFMLVSPQGKLGSKLKPLTNYQIQSVADVRQLAALKDVMRAYCNTLSGASLDPANVNFLGGTKNEIAAFIAMHYEFIPPVVADELTSFLMRVRTREEFTNGYSGSEVTGIQAALKKIDKYFKEHEDVRTFLEKKMTQVVMDYRKLMLAPFQVEISTLGWADILRED